MVQDVIEVRIGGAQAAQGPYCHGAFSRLDERLLIQPAGGDLAPFRGSPLRHEHHSPRHSLRSCRAGFL